jgi:hypothetical protein
MNLFHTFAAHCIFKKGLRQNKKKRYREVHEIKRSRNKYGSNYPGPVQEQQKSK